MAKIELKNDNDLEDIVGGAYRFKDAGDGTYLMKNTNISGTWHVKPENYGTVLKYTSSHGSTAEVEDVITYLKSQGLIY